MASVTLVHSEETLTVPAVQMLAKCSQFQKNTTLLDAPYQVQSSVTLPIFREFASELEGNAVTVTDTNFAGLRRLCEEFGFGEFAVKLSNFQPSQGLNGGEDAEARGRIAALEEQAEQHGRIILALQSEFGRFSIDFGRLAEEVSALRPDVSGLNARIGAGVGDPAAEGLSAEFGELRKEVSALKAPIAAISPPSAPSAPNGPPPPSPARAPPAAPLAVQASLVAAPDPSGGKRSRSGKKSKNGSSGPTTPPGAPPSVQLSPVTPLPPAPAPSLGSVIVSGFPEIFEEFREKHFKILWRGSRDGFRSSVFHGRCDGHANTLTVILDTKGNIFGGFTPVEWESRMWNRKKGDETNCWKADASQKSFLFTLRNPHNVAARKLTLRADGGDAAIQCNYGWGPHFWDIAISNKCNLGLNSWTFLGNAYTNDTGLHGKTFFTGLFRFKVKEIEVFEITD
jgi:hypothetical protein